MKNLVPMLLALSLVACASGTVIRDETGAVDCEAMREKVQRDIVMYGMLGARPSLEAAREHCGEELGLGGEAPDPEGP